MINDINPDQNQETTDMKDHHQMEEANHKEELIYIVIQEDQTYKDLTQEGEQAGRTQEVHSLIESSEETKRNVGHVHLDTHNRIVHITAKKRDLPNLAGNVRATTKNIIVT